MPARETHPLPLASQPGKVSPHAGEEPRETTQDVLRLTFSLLDVLLDHLSFGLLFEDISGRAAYTNRNFCALFGLADASAILGLERDAWFALIEPALAGTGQFADIVRRVADGQREMRDAPFELADGRLCECDYVTVETGGTRVGGLWQIRDVTACVQAERQQHARDAYLRTVIENVPVTLFSLDRRGIVTRVEGRSVEGVPLRPDDVTGMSVFDVLRQLSAESIESMLRRSLDGEELATTIEFGPIAFDVRVSPERDPVGNIIGVMGVAYDVTERRRTEDALRQQNSYLEALHETALALAQRLDPNDLLQSIVVRAARLLGTEHGYLDLIEPDGETIVLQFGSGMFADFVGFRTAPGNGLSGRVLATGQPERTDDYDAWPGRSPPFPRGIIGSLLGAPLCSGDELVGVIGVAHAEPGRGFSDADARLLSQFAELASIALANARLYSSAQRELGERSRTEDALNRQIDVLATLQQVDGELTRSLDMDYVLKVALQAALSLSGADNGFIGLVEGDLVTLAEATEGYSRQLTGDDLLKLDGGILGRVARNRQGEYIADVRAERDHRPFISTTQAQMVLPLVSHDMLVGVLNLETDDAARFNEELFRFVELLAGRIAVALENARLYQNSQTHLAELKTLYNQVSELEQLKTQMIRVAAHDLRSPLGVVTGYLALLREDLGPLAEQFASYLEPMERALQRMQQMTSDVLSLERVRATQADTWEEFDLRETVELAVADNREQSSLKGIALEAELELETVPLVGDPIQVQEAVTNLIGNAIKYTPEGGRVTVRLWSDGRRVIFEVEDNGIGVPDEFKSQLFQPFFRVKTEATSKIDGTGLGLYLVKSIVERHGGMIRFNSVYGKGSTFGFELPLPAATPS